MENFYVDYRLEKGMLVMDVTAKDRNGKSVYLFATANPYGEYYEDLGWISYTDMKSSILNQAKEKNVDSNCLVFS